MPRSIEPRPVRRALFRASRLLGSQFKTMEEISMKKVALLSTLAVLASSVALFTQVQASSRKERSLAAPLQEEDPFACSNETLAGTYGLSISGTRPAPPTPGGTYVPGTIEGTFLVCDLREVAGTIESSCANADMLLRFPQRHSFPQPPCSRELLCQSGLLRNAYAQYPRPSFFRCVRHCGSEPWPRIPEHRRVSSSSNGCHDRPESELAVARCSRSVALDVRLVSLSTPLGHDCV
jgi:hypothetical protein